MTWRRRAGRWARRAVRSWQRASSGIGRNKLPFVLTAGVIAIALAFAGLVRLGAHWAESAASSWDGGAHLVIYLEPGAGPEEAEKVAEVLDGMTSVERATYVTPEQAMARLERVFGAESDALMGVDAALLPASVEVALAGGVPDPAAAGVIEARLAQVGAIEDIEMMGDWVARLDAAARGLRGLGHGLLAFALVASVFIVAASLELGLRARRRERSLLEVLGASPWSARAPILIEGALLGVVGAVGALGLVYAVWRVSHESAAELMGQVFVHAEAGFLSSRELLELSLAGPAAGLVGGALASRRGGLG